ncbi:G-protein coupled receptor 157-like isoform X1 [Montipora foliosa]|uniref:G-protein coupled receptor 157-like isoform X1 n=1 Tax=Montipora foliosa TaxID=591990 RepID=UPI0035F20365
MQTKEPIQNLTVPADDLHLASVGFKDEENELALKILVTLSSAFSLFGTSLIVGTFIAWKDFRSTSRKILVYVSIADFLIAGGNIFGTWIPDPEEDGSVVLCKAQSFITTTATLWSFFWTAFLAVFLYMAVAKKRRSTAEKILRFYHLFAWGTPLILVGTAFGLKILGTPIYLFTSSWCWVDSNLEEFKKKLWLLLLGKAWEVVAYILIFAFYFALKYHIRNELSHRTGQFPSQESINSALKAEKRLTYIPVIFVLLRIWGTIRFILYSFTDVGFHMWLGKVLLYLQGIGDSSQGFANCLLFCILTEKFQTRVRGFTRFVVTKCKGACCRRTKTKSVRFQDEKEFICSTQETPLIEKSASINERSHKIYQTC